MRPGARKQWLLYATDIEAGMVDVYDYRDSAGKLFGQITGFNFPMGDCVDTSGNVYVLDSITPASTIYKFAHAGTSPIRTLRDAYGGAIGCSVDPRNGNLAVSNTGRSISSSDIVIYRHASPGPYLYWDQNLVTVWSPGYDNKGNLFVEGTNASGGAELDELPSGKATFTNISLDGATINSPGGIMWDGTYMAATDQNYQGKNITAIYRIQIAGSRGTVVGTTVLTDSCYTSGNHIEAPAPYIKGNTVMAGNILCRSRFDFWNYTNGGNPERTLPPAIAPRQGGYGQTVSPP
jgi:hypothetical protein